MFCLANFVMIARGHKKLGSLFPKDSHMVMYMAIAHGQSESCTPRCCLRLKFLGVIGGVTVRESYRQRCNYVTDYVLNFRFQRQSRLKPFGRKQIQSSFVAMNSFDEFFIVLCDKARIVSYVLPFFKIENVGFIIAIAFLWPRGRPINECQLIQSKCDRMKHFANECS